MEEVCDNSADLRLLMYYLTVTAANNELFNLVVDV